MAHGGDSYEMPVVVEVDGEVDALRRSPVAGSGVPCLGQGYKMVEVEIRRVGDGFAVVEADPLPGDGAVAARSPRRQAAVHSDLTALGLHRKDIDQTTRHGHALLNLAAHNESGYINTKLARLRNHIRPHRGQAGIGDLYQQLATASQ